MAPRNQSNATAKRNQRTGAASVSRNNASRKATTNKSVKSSMGSKPAPVAPLTISKLNDLGNEEAAFPRGGGSVLTPLEYKEITNQVAMDVLFDTDTDGVLKGPRGRGVDLEGEDNKPKKKRRKVEHTRTEKKAESRPAEDKGPRVEGLSFKVCAT